MSEPIAGLAVSLDRGSPVPLYFQVATQLEKMIESGEMPVGGRLANEVELADRLGVSRPLLRAWRRRSRRSRPGRDRGGRRRDRPACP